MANWDSLTAEQRNAKVALEVMGYHRGEEPSQCWFNTKSILIHPFYTYRPTEDIAQAWEVQERVEKLKLLAQWGAALVRLVGISFGHPLSPVVAAMVACATADQRCHAAVLAVDGIKETP